jgi:hypothetical protein
VGKLFCNLKLLEHKELALRTFMLQFRTSVDFVQRPSNVREGGIRLDLMEMVCYSVGCIHLFQDNGCWCELCICGDEQLVSCVAV